MGKGGEERKRGGILIFWVVFLRIFEWVIIFWGVFLDVRRESVLWNLKIRYIIEIVIINKELYLVFLKENEV